MYLFEKCFIYFVFWLGNTVEQLIVSLIISTTYFQPYYFCKTRRKHFKQKKNYYFCYFDFINCSVING